jgi:KUP system potassium uptake protein
MGHFGWKPIKYAWYGLVLPALLLNYFGQGALLMNDGGEASRANPFFAMVPRSLLIPMVLLATTAAVIASQALISGAFSLTRSAVQLGFLPRLRIVHTSHETRGQIYIRGVNVAMGVACILLVLGFRRSTSLAGAYGIAVTAVMAITSTLWWFVADRVWNWRRRTTVPLLVLFLLFDVGYFAANFHKIPEGGWVPIVVGISIFAIMGTWKTGRDALYKRMTRGSIPLEVFAEDVEKRKIHRVPGTAVFMSAATVGTPPVLLHHLKHNKVLHDQIVLLSIQVQDVPKVDTEDRIELHSYPEGFYRVVARYGYMETPHVPSIFVRAEKLGLRTNPMDTSFYLGRETLLTTGDSGLLGWRKKLFAVLSKNATNPTSYFGLPPGRVIELGMQVDL